MKYRGAALALMAAILIAGTIGSAFAYSTQYTDSFKETPIENDYFVILSDNNSWSGNVWNETMTLDVSNCAHHTLYATVKIADLTGIADETLIKVSFAGQEGSSKCFTAEAEISGFLYTVSEEDTTISVTVTLPTGTDWPQDAKMTVTIMAVNE